MMFSIAELTTAEQSIKKSRFVALAMPVTSVEQAQAFLASQHDATTTHQCWAWRIAGQSRVNDDGEPSGTAGRPILAVIEGQALDNIFVLVNRWYGGVKLGTGGLVRAYAGTAQLCLKLAQKIECIAMQPASFFVQFAEWPRVEYFLKTNNIQITQQHFESLGIKLTVLLAQNSVEDVNSWLQTMTAGREQLIVVEQKLCD